MTSPSNSPETPATIAAQDSPTPDAPAEVLWRGAPSVGCYVLRGWWLPAVVGIGLLAFSALWEWVAITGNHLVGYPLTALPFVFLGIYAIAVRALLLWRIAVELEYEVGKRSVVLRRRRSGQVVWSLDAVALPPAAIVASWPGTDLAFFGVPEREGPWGWWRLVDDRLRFSCLSEPAAVEAMAAVDGLREAGGVTSARAWARGLVTPQSSHHPGYDPQPPVGTASSG